MTSRSNKVASDRGGTAKDAFTLIELLVVIAVIAVLISMLIPALQMARAQAKKVVCSAHLHQLGVIWTMYADDNSDYYPPRFNTGGFNYVMKFLHDELDEIDVSDGKVFYCSDYVYKKDPLTGLLRDWYNPYHPVSFAAEWVYEIGYDTFTHVIHIKDTVVSALHENNLPWVICDGVSPAPWCSWDYAYWCSDPEYLNIIPPVRTSERNHTVSDNSGTSRKRINIIPERTPILFDEAWSLRPDMDFDKNRCRHYNANTGKPYGVQAVYMDGHTLSRSPEEIAVLRYKGPHGQHWF